MKKREEIDLDLKGLLNNKLQRKILGERFSDSLEGQADMLEWIKNKSARFREDFDNLWDKLKNDENYIEVFNLAEDGDDYALLKVLYDNLNENF